MTIKPKAIDLYWQDDVTSFVGIHNDGIERVIHKASEGVTDIDPAYASRMREAEACALEWEAYHFWRSDPAEAQAKNFLAVAGNVSRWALDYEVNPHGQEHMKEVIVDPDNVVATMQAIQAGCSGVMMLYGPKNYIEALVAAASDEQQAFLSTAELWWAEYGVKAPKLSAAVKEIWPSGPTYWQYTETGKIKGVSGKVDLNCVLT